MTKPLEHFTQAAFFARERNILLNFSQVKEKTEQTIDAFVQNQRDDWHIRNRNFEFNLSIQWEILLKATDQIV